MKIRHPSILRQRLWPLAALLLTASLPTAFGVEALLTDDSTVYSGSSAATQGDAAIQTVNSTTTKCAVLRFEIASMLPAGLTADNIATATLRLYTADTPTGSGTIDIYTVKTSKSWNEGNAAGVWTSGTDYDATPVLANVGVANFALKDYTALDVTSAVKGWITTPANNNGLIIRPSGTIGLTFQTKEASTICHNATLDITLKGDVGEVVGLYNSTYGTGALSSNTTGFENVATGYHALSSNTEGFYNVASGYGALYSNTLGSANISIGHSALYSNSTGVENVAAGMKALYSNTGGGDNVAMGAFSMYENTTGQLNVAIGTSALYSNTTGIENTAIGHFTLQLNTGDDNTAFGIFSLSYNTTGVRNTALGQRALVQNTTGNDNIAIGSRAGVRLTTGSNNIHIGNEGSAAEGNTIRIGVQGTQTATYIAGISGATAASGVAVYVNTSGQLGTLTSSAKFKRDIANMDGASEAILSLRPVNFRYKEEIDSENIPQYGLIAEEVAEIAPDLVARDAKGDIYTVRYEAVNAMLLNEFQKEHKRVEAQAEMIARQQEQIQKLTESMAELSRRLPAPTDRN